VSNNSNGANGLSYYLYPPPAYNSVEAEGDPQTGSTLSTGSIMPCTFCLQDSQSAAVTLAFLLLLRKVCIQTAV